MEHRRSFRKVFGLQARQTVTALLYLLVILAFLVWFIVTHLQRVE